MRHKTFNRLLKWLGFVLLLFSCQKEFNSDAWKKNEEGGFYPHRDTQVERLLNTDVLRGMSKNEVIKLLGEPNDSSLTDSRTIVYRYNVEDVIGYDIEPYLVSFLEIEFESQNLYRYSYIKSFPQ